MYTDPLKNSLASFIAWRNGKDYRAKVKTRFAMLAYCGKSWTIAPDHSEAYFHAVEDFGAPVWDSEQDAGVRGASGYYADNFGDEIIRWCVVKIAPANKKHDRAALYAPITYGTGYEGVTLHLDCAGTQEDAQSWGESKADKLAEEYREYDAKFQAEQQTEEARDTIHSLNAKALKLIRAIKESRALSPAICEALRENLEGLLATRTEQFQRIATLESDYWEAVR